MMLVQLLQLCQSTRLHLLMAAGRIHWGGGYRYWWLAEGIFLFVKRTGVRENSSGGFQRNSLAMQVSLYMSIPIMSPCNHFSSITCVEGKVAGLGELIAASVAQGGSGLYIFNRSTFNYMCGNDININSLGPIATKVVNSVCNPEGLRNEKKREKKVAQEVVPAGIEPPTSCLRALSANHSIKYSWR